MIAKIKTDHGTVYDTVVFAILLDGWDSKIIGFDEKLETLQELPYYYLSPERHFEHLLVFVDSDEEGWFADETISGLKWLVGDPDLLKMILEGEPLPEEILARCKALQNEVNPPEWREVTEGKALDDLLLASGGFHDGSIAAVETDGDSACISITVCGGVIHLRVENAILSPLCKVDYGNMGEILDCSLFFENGRIYWADEYGLEKADELTDEFCYFSGTKMLWKIEVE